MLRFAVRLLLALVLGLNGFLAPVAMAAHADRAAATAPQAEHKASPCHGDDAAADSASTDPAGHDSTPSCCKPGLCVCACVFSLSLPIVATGTLAPRSQPVPLPRTVALPPARTTVPLRPPIV